MIDFFTKPFLKDAKNQSHKAGSPEAPEPLNNIQWFHPLKKYLNFRGLNFGDGIFSEFLSYLNPWWYYSTNPWTK